MHTELFYNKKHCKAFVVIGFCKNFEDIQLEISLFETYKKIKLPVNYVEFRVIDLYKYAGMVVVAFPLHPVKVFQDTEWVELTKDNAHLLKPRQYRIETNFI